MLNFKKYIHNNQFIAKNENVVFFKSYDSLVAFVNTSTKKVVLGDDWNYSKTTLRHLNRFLDEFFMPGRYFTKECQKRIKEGDFLKNQILLNNLFNEVNI